MRQIVGRGMGAFVVAALAGCATPPARQLVMDRPDVAPASQPAIGQPYSLDASHVKPMYRELLSIDLRTVLRVAAAGNAEIRTAREQVRAAQGRLQSAVGAAFPAIVPSALFEHVEGTVRATEGNLVGVGFNTFQPSVALQWIINPGRVAYDIIAAKKRLAASEQLEQAALLETLRTAALQYYELVLLQARLTAAHQAVAEAEELLRITRLKTRTGTGIRADELRAEARVAERRQDLVLELNAFYQASLGLAVTLQVEDPLATFVPSQTTVQPVSLVRDDIAIDDLVAYAVSFRPDLAAVRTLIEAAEADRGGVWWGAFGPQFQVAYQYGGITGHANNVLKGKGFPTGAIRNPFSSDGTFSPSPFVNERIKDRISRYTQRFARDRDQTFVFTDQQRFNASAGWRLSVSAIGDLKTAGAAEAQAEIEAGQRLVEVKADIASAHQASRTNAELIRLAHTQLVSAAEALRLTQANLEAGTMTALDVLQAQDALAQARVRLADAVVKYNQSQVNLLAALGLLDEHSLTARMEVGS